MGPTFGATFKMLLLCRAEIGCVNLHGQPEYLEEISMIRKAKAVWHGTGRAGNGNLSTDSGVLSSTPYSFRTRFETEKGTNPEELIAAAHAGCFTMALSKILGDAGMTAEKIETEA